MAKNINDIVVRLKTFRAKEKKPDLPDIEQGLNHDQRMALLTEAWPVICRGLSGTRKQEMICKAEAAWIAELAGYEQPDLELLSTFKEKKGDIPYSTAELTQLFDSYLDHFLANPNPSGSTEVPTLEKITRPYGRLSHIPALKFQLMEVPDYLRIIVPSQPLDLRISQGLDTMALSKYGQVPQEPNLATHATHLKKVTTKLNNMGLAFLDRLLLARLPIYKKILATLITENSALLGDALGFADSVVRKLQEVKRALVEKIVLGVIEDNRIQLTGDEVQLLTDNVEAAGLPLAPKTVEAFVIKIHNASLREGGLSELVERYIDRDEIKKEKFTADIKRRMVSHLLANGVNITDHDKFDKGGYDEYFALAYNNALRSAEGTMYGSPAAGGWDFSVDTFDEVVDQAIIRENILAVGFLDYAYELGEKAHIFQLMDVLYLNWNSGILDLPQSEVTDILERLWQDRDRRDSPEERAMAYRKALGKGNAEVLERMIVNHQFEDLWASLMEEVANYIRKAEEISIIGEGAAPVSRIPIYQATKELQYNLTEYGNGRTKTQAAQLRSLLDTCFQVLDAPEIIDFYGFGSHRDRWTVIARLHKEPPFASTPNLQALRTVAGKGNKVFQWIADFNEASVTDQEFETFLRAAEAWIIARSSAVAEDDYSLEEEDSFDDFEDEFDDFED